MTADRSRGMRVAFFGATTLLSREIRRHLESKGFPALTVSLYDSRGEEGSLSEFAGEALIVQRPVELLVESCDLGFVCGDGDPEAGRYLDWIAGGGGVAVDLAGSTSGRRDVPVINCDVNPELLTQDTRLVAAPMPAAHALSTVLDRLRGSFPILGATATVFRPASERGDEGIEELHLQTAALLSFSSLPTGVLGRQSAFDLFPVSLLGDGEARLEERARQEVLGVLRATDLPLDIRIFQAPIFHGHACTLHVRLDAAPGVEDVIEALDEKGVIIISRGEDGRTPAGLAEEGGIRIAEVLPAQSSPGSFWLWFVSDGIRSGTALNAARLAERIVGITV